MRQDKAPDERRCRPPRRSGSESRGARRGLPSQEPGAYARSPSGGTRRSGDGPADRVLHAYAEVRRTERDATLYPETFMPRWRDRWGFKGAALEHLKDRYAQ